MEERNTPNESAAKVSPELIMTERREWRNAMETWKYPAE